MNKPTNLCELIIYLQASPQVWREDNRLWDFLYYRSGGLWFSDEKNLAWYVPIFCRLTTSEIGLDFYDNRFELTKSGVTHSYFYKKK